MCIEAYAFLLVCLESEPSPNMHAHLRNCSTPFHTLLEASIGLSLRLMSGVLLCGSLLFEAGFFIDPHAHPFGRRGWPASSRDPLVTTFTALKSKMCVIMFGFDVGTRD